MEVIPSVRTCTETSAYVMPRTEMLQESLFLVIQNPKTENEMQNAVRLDGKGNIKMQWATPM
eukprot:3712021-Amphidinium_carterae.1